jgi:hypothetical protein
MCPNDIPRLIMNSLIFSIVFSFPNMYCTLSRQWLFMIAYMYLQKKSAREKYMPKGLSPEIGMGIKF